MKFQQYSKQFTKLRQINIKFRNIIRLYFVQNHLLQLLFIFDKKKKLLRIQILYHLNFFLNFNLILAVFYKTHKDLHVSLNIKQKAKKLVSYFKMFCYFVVVI